MPIDLYFFWMSTWCLCYDDGTAVNSYDFHKHIDDQVQRLGHPARDWASQCQRRLPPVPKDLWRPLHRGISLHLLLEIYPNPLTFVSSDRSLLCYDASLRVRRQATFTSGSAPMSPDVLVCIISFRQESQIQSQSTQCWELYGWSSCHPPVSAPKCLPPSCEESKEIVILYLNICHAYSIDPQCESQSLQRKQQRGMS